MLELEFYTSDFCLPDSEGRSTKLSGTPLAMQGPRHLEVQNAYDGSERQDTTWKSSCSQGRGGRGCIPGEAWIGLYMRGSQPEVRCFRILQTLGRC